MTIKNIKKLAEDACKKETNPFGYGDWKYHILSVAKNGKNLAKILNADMEIVEISALLHDYAGILNIEFYPEHHIHGARLAEEILKKYGYPQERIEKIKHCILSHRGSKDIPPETLEAKIISSADAMAHFDTIGGLFKVNFLIQKDKNQGEITKFIREKYINSYNKLSDDAKKIVKPKFDAAMLLLT